MSYYRYQNSSYYRPSFFGGFQYFPPVIKSLMVINAALFMFANFIGLFRLENLELAPYVSHAFSLYPIGSGFQVFQLVTYMFMHGGLLHLIFNMLMLWMFGMELERIWGSRKFLAFYLICGIGAGLANILIAPLFGAAGPTVGASGAIYGVMVAYAVTYPDNPILLYFFLPMRAKYAVMLFIGIDIVIGVTGSGDGIAHFAHLGGAAVGFIYLMIERQQNFIAGLMNRTKERVLSEEHVSQNASHRRASEDIADAKYYDIHESSGNDPRSTQQRIDEILDKISQNGYQSLTEAEKKTLFEASKKLN